jgi:hypothetical protein
VTAHHFDRLKMGGKAGGYYRFKQLGNTSLPARDSRPSSRSNPAKNCQRFAAILARLRKIPGSRAKLVTIKQIFLLEQ